MEKVKSIWLDGALVPFDDADLHFYTHTLHYGLGVFEGIRAYEQPDGRAGVFRLGEHIQRLIDSARVCLMPTPFGVDAICEAVAAVLRDNELRECYIRPLLWIGEGSMGIGARDNPTHTGIGAFPWGPYLGADALKKGIRCCVSSLNRISHTTQMTRAKICGQYVNSILAKRAAQQSGYDEAILLDHQGHVAEGTGENVFIVRNGVLKTPPSSAPILPGLTRATILELARDHAETLGVRVAEESFSRDDMYLADELFLTGTAAEVTPVREVDGRVIGAGVPGPVASTLASLYSDAVRGRLEGRSSWITVV